MKELAEAVAIALLQLSALAIIFVIIIAIRIHLVFNHAICALQIVNQIAQQARLYGISPIRYFEKLDSYGSYDLFLFDLTKWTFRQLYPDLRKQITKMAREDYLRKCGQ